MKKEVKTLQEFDMELYRFSIYEFPETDEHPIGWQVEVFYTEVNEVIDTKSFEVLNDAQDHFLKSVQSYAQYIQEEKFRHMRSFIQKNIIELLDLKTDSTNVSTKLVKGQLDAYQEMKQFINSLEDKTNYQLFREWRKENGIN